MALAQPNAVDWTLARYYKCVCFWSAPSLDVVVYPKKTGIREWSGYKQLHPHFCLHTPSPTRKHAKARLCPQWVIFCIKGGAGIALLWCFSHDGGAMLHRVVDVATVFVLHAIIASNESHLFSPHRLTYTVCLKTPPTHGCLLWLVETAVVRSRRGRTAFRNWSA